MHILVIDDERAARQILVRAVTKAGHTIEEAAGVIEGSAKLADGDFDVALCDIQMPDGSGLDLVRDARAAGIETAIVMVTGFASFDTAVEALRAGASDYITKPVQNEELLHRLSQIKLLSGLREQNRALRTAIDEHNPELYTFVSPCMREVDRLASKVAPTEGTVLITGESGTGKGVAAHRIHDASRRRDGMFVQVNCSAIPEHLLEAELFGHTKGAFTGASQASKGLFVQADGGTLFLDEIGELPLAMQTKLLHVVEEKEVRPLGGAQVRRVDVRIVAATNSDLAECVRAGTFREDLYFRINMFHMHMPPLRERQEDIAPLIQFLLRAHVAAEGRRREISVAPDAQAALLAYKWPGNVRELDNVIGRACLLADADRVTIADLPSHVIAASPSSERVGSVGLDSRENLRDRLRRIEIEILLQTINEAGGDRKLAAEQLGIGLSSLYRKLEEVELPATLPAEA